MKAVVTVSNRNEILSLFTCRESLDGFVQLQQSKRTLTIHTRPRMLDPVNLLQMMITGFKIGTNSL